MPGAAEGAHTPQGRDTPARCAAAESTSITCHLDAFRGAGKAKLFGKCTLGKGTAGDKHAKSLGINEMKPEHPSTSARETAA